jgi:cyclic pyranopterin phosphate synthase
MVSVAAKPETARRAVARGRIVASREAIAAVRGGRVAKGDPLAVATLAGIQAAKLTPTIVPLCHPLPLTGVDIDVAVVDGAIEVTATVETVARTGAEMEALTAAAAALLSIYDMLKAIDRGMVIESVRLLEKEGGRSGRWVAEDGARENGREVAAKAPPQKARVAQTPIEKARASRAPRTPRR